MSQASSRDYMNRLGTSSGGVSLIDSIPNYDPSRVPVGFTAAAAAAIEEFRYASSPNGPGLPGTIQSQ